MVIGQTRTGRGADPWLPFGTPSRHDKLRLFCIPHAGAGASAYLGWDATLKGDIAVYPLQLPGRESRYREPLLTSARILADELVKHLLWYLDTPFAIFGHSMGALLCYELARRLESAGFQPAHIFVSARRAPHLPREGAAIHLMSDDVLLKALHDFNGVPARILSNGDWARTLIPIVRADSAVDETYVWENSARLSCNTSAFCGSEDSYVRINQVHAWSAHTTGRFSLRLFPGNHFFVKTAQNAVLHTIQKELNVYLAGLK